MGNVQQELTQIKQRGQRTNKSQNEHALGSSVHPGTFYAVLLVDPLCVSGKRGLSPSGVSDPLLMLFLCSQTLCLQ